MRSVVNALCAVLLSSLFLFAGALAMCSCVGCVVSNGKGCNAGCCENGECDNQCRQCPTRRVQVRTPRVSVDVGPAPCPDNRCPNR